MIRAVFARSLLVAGLLVPAPLLADTRCLPLGGQLALCPEGGLWADAVPVSAFGAEEEVRAYEVPPLYLEASLEFIDRGEVGSVDIALSMIEDFNREEALAEGDPAPVRRLRETIVTDHATVTLDMFTEVMFDETYLFAVLLAEDGDDWLTLFLSNDDPMSEARFEAAARDLVAALRPDTEE